MEKNKVFCGIASFLIGTTGSAMYLIGKCKGEKKIKEKFNENINPLIMEQNAKIRASNKGIEFADKRREFYSSKSDKLINLNEMHIARLETKLEEASNTKDYLNELQEIINND